MGTALFVYVSGYVYRLSCTLSFRVHVKLFIVSYRIVYMQSAILATTWLLVK